MGGSGEVSMNGIREVFSSFAVDDIERARTFYGEVLGLSVRDVELGIDGADVPRGLELPRGTDGRILIYPRAEHEPAEFTVINIVVEDVEAAVDDLIARGVTFEQYEVPKTDGKGIHRTPEVHPVAWLRDPAGNVISIVEA